MAEVRATAKYMRISPRKVKQVIDLIKGKSLAEADAILKFTPKAAAKIISKVLGSASANAENNLKLNKDNLYVATAFANQGPTLKRYRPRAMGRAAKIRKRTTHITVVLKEREA